MNDFDDPDADWRSDPITRNQKDYIWKLGGSVRGIKTKGEASDLIDRLKSIDENGATPRQIMVLRFWNLEEHSERSKEDVTDWMDSLYEEKPDCLRAWELWNLVPLHPRKCPTPCDTFRHALPFRAKSRPARI